MADYYTQFSVEVFIKQPEKLRTVIDALDGLGIRDEFDDSKIEELLHSDSWKELLKNLEDDGYCCTHQSFNQETDSRGDVHRLYVYAEEWGNVEFAALYIKSLMEEGIAESHPVLLTWAHTCSKPRAGSFEGGACLITTSQTHWQPSADRWADEIIQKCYPKADPHEIRVSLES